jgi:hypothetical protein
MIVLVVAATVTGLVLIRVQVLLLAKALRDDRLCLAVRNEHLGHRIPI